MEDNSPKWRLIDRFLRQDMTAHEQQSFHKSLQEDEDLRQSLALESALRRRNEEQADTARSAVRLMRRRREVQRLKLLGLILALLILVFFLLWYR